MLVNSDKWGGLDKGEFTVNVYIYVRSKKDKCRRRYRDGMPKVIEIR